MPSLKNIFTVARYETKTLLRSWFFRIFAGLVLIVLTFLNLVFFGEIFETMPWFMRGIPGAIPYFNMLLLNSAQAVIVIFLAADFLKRDNKLNTTQVIYMRSMTNAEYITGKLFGLLQVFIALDLFMLFLAAVIQLAFADVSFQLLPFLYYFVLVGVPSLVFMIGMAFIMMVLFRSHAVTFMVLLGYVALTLFFLNTKVNYLFDVIGFFVPMAFSDFVGFGNLTPILVQRAIYLSIGLAFIFASIFLFKRLPQSNALRVVAPVLTGVFLFLGAFLIYAHVNQWQSDQHVRDTMRKLNDQYADHPVIHIDSCGIELWHQGRSLTSKSTLLCSNRTDENIDELLFSLNPGLRIDEVKIAGNAVSVERDYHHLRIGAPQPVPPGSKVKIEITGSGQLDDRVCYLDVSEEQRQKMQSIMLYKIAKQHSFVTSDYVLLPPAALWYPVAGPTEGSNLVRKQQKQFTQFSLEVNKSKNLVPVSQGEQIEHDNTIIFQPETPLPQISLVIAPFQKRSIVVDSLAYNLYTLPEHDYFIEYTSVLGDSLEILIRESRDDYEDAMGLSYPFPRLSLVETPIQFTTFERPLIFHNDAVQPEQIFLPENGAPVSALDLKNTMRFAERQSQRRNQSVPESEMQFQAVKRFIDTELLGTQTRRPWENDLYSGRYQVFPNYYSYVNNVTAENLPVLGPAFESYWLSRTTEQRGAWRFMEAISSKERAQIALKDSSMKDILESTDDAELANSVLETKSIFLFYWMQAHAGKEECQRLLIDMLINNRFQNLSFQQIMSAYERSFGHSLDSFIDQWYVQEKLPGYLFSDIEHYQVIEDARTRYQVKATISNPEPVDGLVVVDYRLRGQGGFGPFGGNQEETSEYERLVNVPAGSAVRFAQVLADEPRTIRFNTLLSKNLPIESEERFEKFEERNSKPVDETRVLDALPSLQEPGEIIVDNEDEGFSVQGGKKSTLKQLFESSRQEEDEYVPFQFWRGPRQWRKTLNNNFYGRYVKSAHYKRAGDGEQKVQWQAEIPESARYKVFCFGEDIPRPGPRRGGEFFSDFHFAVHHDDGVDEIQFDAGDGVGWNSLGTFYFSAGPAKIVLSDKTKGRFIFADAVKWVQE